MENIKQELPLISNIYHGDALKLLTLIPRQSIDLILSDPPYVISQPNNFHTMGRKGIDFGQWDVEFEQSAWLNLAYPLLKPGASLVVFVDWKKITDVISICEGFELITKRLLSWRKDNPFPRNINRSFVQNAEYAVWFTKSGEKWTFNKRDNMPYERGEFHYPVQRSIHKTKKPDGLFKEIIEILSNPGDLILDPFGGVGTCMYASEMSGRRCISFEQDLDYYKEAVKHWEEAKRRF